MSSNTYTNPLSNDAMGQKDIPIFSHFETNSVHSMHPGTQSKSSNVANEPMAGSSLNAIHK